MISNPLWRRLLVICGLSAVAFTAPLLDLYGRNPEVFVANRTSPVQIVLFGLIVALLVPLVSLGLLLLARKGGEETLETAYQVIVGVLSFATGLVVSRQVSPDSYWIGLVLAVGVGAGVWILTRKITTVFVVASLALPLVLGLFLTTSDTARLVWGTPEASSGSVEVSNPSSLVLVQLDELPVASLMTPEGQINADLFPNFAKLSTEGTWYRNALSDSIATTQSVPAILTGRRGEKGLSPSAVDHPENLFTLLDGVYEMQVIEWVASMCPEDVCPDFAGRAPARFTALLADLGVVYGHLTLPGESRASLPSIDNAWKGFLGQADTPDGAPVEIEGLPVPDGSTRVRWANWLERLSEGIYAGMPPTVSYAHLEAPHVPWVTNPSGTHYDRPEDYTEVEGVEGDGHWGSNPKLALLAYQRHLYQLGFVDTMIGRLINSLEETGEWDETMVVVLSDHGASFVPGEHRRWPKDDNRDDLYRVPLFVKYPGQSAGEVVDEPVFGIDLLPTIVNVMGVDTDWEFDGISLTEVAGVQRQHEPIRWCCNGDGVDTSMEALFAQVERNWQWIPDQRSWSGVSAVGEYGYLVGTPTDELLVVGSDEIVWSLDRGAELVDAEPESGELQTLLTGRLETTSDMVVDDLLVAVNGEIAGVGFVTKDSANGGELRALLDESAIRDGLNELDILVPSPDADGFLSGTSSVLTVSYLTEDGRELDVRAEGHRRVQIDEVAETDSGWELRGWAADVSRDLTPTRLYVYAGETLLVTGQATEENRNVVRWFDSESLLESGFVIEVEGAEIPEGVGYLTVIAEFDDISVLDRVSLG